MQTNLQNLRKPIILIAEDGPGDRELIRRALSNAAYGLDFVNDGAQAQAYLQSALGSNRNAAPSLILLDLNMPRVTGIQVVEWLRRDMGDSITPVVIFSSSDNPDDIRNCYLAGCSSYVVKPTDLDPFNAALQGVTRYWLELVSVPPVSMSVAATPGRTPFS